MDMDAEDLPSLHNNDADLSGNLHPDGRVESRRRGSVESEEGMFVDQDHELLSSPSSAPTASGGSRASSNDQDFNPVLDHLEAHRNGHHEFIELDQDDDGEDVAPDAPSAIDNPELIEVDDDDDDDDNSAASTQADDPSENEDREHRELGDGLDDDVDEADEDDDDAFDQAAFDLPVYPNPDCSDCQVYARKVRHLDESNAKKAVIIAVKDAAILELQQRHWASECRRLQKTNRGLERRVADLTAEVADLTKKLTDAQARLKDFRVAQAQLPQGVPQPINNANQQPVRGLVRRARVRDWQATALFFIAGIGDGAWIDVVRRSNSQENMPKDINCVHPYVRFVGRNAQGSESGSASDSGSKQARPKPFDPMANFRYPWRGSFDKLPDDLVVKILSEILVFEGKLVHCFSRLDPFEAPAALPTNNAGASNLIRSFFIGGEDRKAISLTHDTLVPSVVLAALVVCRRWNFFGVHLFYGVNTLAFSSFGEFDRFCAGSGARIQRIANIELHWKGSTVVRWADEPEVMQGPGFLVPKAGGIGNQVDPLRGPRNAPSRKDESRTPLAWLAQDSLSRLETLAIFINESGHSHIRRPFEGLDEIQHHAGATAGHPNGRLTRALRVCRGWDWLHQLRGMRYIRIYDTPSYLKTFRRQRSVVRDITAVWDLNRTCRVAKTQPRAQQADLRNLEHFWFNTPGWQPQNEHFVLADHIYEDSGEGYDVVANVIDKDESDDGIESEGNSEEASEGDDQDSSESGENDSDNAARAVLRAGTPAPGSRIEELSDDGSEEDMESEIEEDGEDDESEVGVRQRRTQEYVESLLVDRDLSEPAGDDLFPTVPRRAASEGAHVNRLDTPLRKGVEAIMQRFHNKSREIIEIEDEEDEDEDEGEDDDEVQIIEPPPEQRHRRSTSAFAEMQRRRRSTTSGGLFVTPLPEERTPARGTVSPGRALLAEAEVVQDDSSVGEELNQSIRADSRHASSPTVSPSRAATDNPAGFIDLTEDDDDDDGQKPEEQIHTQTTDPARASAEPPSAAASLSPRHSRAATGATSNVIDLTKEDVLEDPPSQSNLADQVYVTESPRGTKRARSATDGSDPGQNRKKLLTSELRSKSE